MEGGSENAPAPANIERQASPCLADLSKEDANSISGTGYSKTWAISVLRRLLEHSHDEEEFSKSKPKDESDEALELDDDLQDDLGQLWDMTLDENVARFLIDQECNAVDIIMRTLKFTKNSRLEEIIGGILGNMCSVYNICVKLTYTKALQNSVSMSLLKSTFHPLAMREMMRLALTCVKNPEVGAVWVKELVDTPCVEDLFTFVLQSAKDVHLLKYCADLLGSLMEADDRLCETWASRDLVRNILIATDEIGHQEKEDLKPLINVLYLLSTSQIGVQCLLSRGDEVMQLLIDWLDKVCDELLLVVTDHLQTHASVVALLNVLFIHMSSTAHYLCTKEGAIVLKNMMKTLDSVYNIYPAHDNPSTLPHCLLLQHQSSSHTHLTQPLDAAGDSTAGDSAAGDSAAGDSATTSDTTTTTTANTTNTTTANTTNTTTANTTNTTTANTINTTTANTINTTTVLDAAGDSTTTSDTTTTTTATTTNTTTVLAGDSATTSDTATTTNTTTVLDAAGESATATNTTTATTTNTTAATNNTTTATTATTTVLDAAGDSASTTAATTTTTATTNTTTSKPCSDTAKATSSSSDSCEDSRETTSDKHRTQEQGEGESVEDGGGKEVGVVYDPERQLFVSLFENLQEYFRNVFNYMYSQLEEEQIQADSEGDTKKSPSMARQRGIRQFLPVLKHLNTCSNRHLGYLVSCLVYRVPDPLDTVPGGDPQGSRETTAEGWQVVERLGHLCSHLQLKHAAAGLEEVSDTLRLITGQANTDKSDS